MLRKCKSVRYCSRECQTSHWNAGHKKECKLFAQAKAGNTSTGKPADPNNNDGDGDDV